MTEQQRRKEPVNSSKIMDQAQVFASAWSLVGGQFDSGGGMETAEREKKELRLMAVEIERQRDSLLELVKQSYQKKNCEYLELLSRYAGTKFENDPVITKLRDWVKKADELMAEAEATC